MKVSEVNRLDKPLDDPLTASPYVDDTGLHRQAILTLVCSPQQILTQARLMGTQPLPTHMEPYFEP